MIAKKRPPACRSVGDGNLLVAEGQRIRKVTPAGVVTTVAGNSTIASVDGTGTAASFSYAFATTIDNKGNLYVVEGGAVLPIPFVRSLPRG
jgi:hypothetical protein